MQILLSETFAERRIFDKLEVTTGNFCIESNHIQLSTALQQNDRRIKTVLYCQLSPNQSKSDPRYGIKETGEREKKLLSVVTLL